MTSTDGLAVEEGGWDGTGADDRRTRLAGTEAGLRVARFRMVFVFVLTCLVVGFAALIAVWMYWMGGQLPGPSTPGT